MNKQKCQARVWGGWHQYDCLNKAKVERDGKWYCGIHDPVRCAEKDADRRAKWDNENAISNLKYERRTLEHDILKNKTMDELKKMADDCQC